MSMARFFYTLLLHLAAPLIALKLVWRSFKQPEYLQHLGERFGWYDDARKSVRPVIWLHAVSVGETRAAQPLVEALQARYPGIPLLITHMTPTGREAAMALFGARVLHAYLPYDYPWAVSRFLEHYRPCLGLFIETELWPNLLAACRRRKIPAGLVNARMSQKSARGYMRLAALTREMLHSLTFVCAQGEDDAARLRDLGAQNVVVCGNIKFDIAPDARLAAQGEQWRSALAGSRRVLLAASTRDGEEALILDAFSAIPEQQRKDILLVLVPRHPQRFDEAAALIDKTGLVRRRRSIGQFADAATQVWLGDSMGEMPAWYAFCDVAFIGGSLLPFGAHNLIEACALGKPVIIGPSTFNFKEASSDAIACGAAVQATDAHDLMQQALGLLGNEEERLRKGGAAREFAARHRGATQRTMAQIELRLAVE
jgi:3-deoxy-D-manno-octulosonic-acid transferase